jgi:hypothetical protein
LPRAPAFCECFFLVEKSVRAARRVSRREIGARGPPPLPPRPARPQAPATPPRRKAMHRAKRCRGRVGGRERWRGCSQLPLPTHARAVPSPCVGTGPSHMPSPTRSGKAARLRRGVHCALPCMHMADGASGGSAEAGGGTGRGLSRLFLPASAPRRGAPRTRRLLLRRLIPSGKPTHRHRVKGWTEGTDVRVSSQRLGPGVVA